MENLKRKRGGFKCKLTIFSKYILALNDKVTKGETISDLEVLQAIEMVNNIGHLQGEFDEVQGQIENTVQFELLEDEYTEREEFYNKYYSQLAVARKIIRDNQQVACIEDDKASERSKNSYTGIELKPIELPKFDGNYNNWLDFADLFESLVNRNEYLDNIRRFHYLRSSLQGGAAQVIRTLEFTAENYAVAWKLIRERYDNKRLLISNHVNALFNIEPIHKESSNRLRQLVDIFSKHLYALKQLGLPTDSWDILLIHIISCKFDTSTLRAWENSKTHNEIPSFEDFKTFLKSRADLLESLEVNQAEKQNIRNISQAGAYSRNTKYSQNIRGLHSAQGTLNKADNTQCCPICKREHTIYQCGEFLKLSSRDRFDKVRQVNLCTNCLKPGHFYKRCRQSTCKKCASKHHTLLHPDRSSEQNTALVHQPVENASDIRSVDNIQGILNTTNLSVSAVSATDQTILSTVLVNIFDGQGKAYIVRALLDCGSQSSFITENLCDRLRLKTTSANISVMGINNIASPVRYKCEVNIQSRSDISFHTILSCFVIPEITGCVPASEINISDLQIPKHLKLADSHFHKPQKIDLLIGSDLFWQILGANRISLGKNKPFMLETMFGWIIAGPYISQNKASERRITKCNFTNTIEVTEQLSKFWELEEVFNGKPALSGEEIACEKHFEDTVKRDATGKFVVSLPFKEPISSLGDSFRQAKNRFLNLERKLNKDANLKTLYSEFIREYEELGHMKSLCRITEAAIDFSGNTTFYFMPHHPVLKESSLTTRLRVVFDCSAPTTNGISLNSIQMAGPTLQNDLLSILLRFRTHLYVVSADIEKMYRQVSVADDQKSLQCILWRNNPEEPLEIFQLQTVTYGMKCSSYLAIKCLMTLAEEQEAKNPNIASIIKSDFYVDDLLTGFDSKQKAREACKQLFEVLKGGGFTLRKFYSNDPEILRDIPDNSTTGSVIQFGENEKAKTLGLLYSPQSDTLFYSINSSLGHIITKRNLLSDIAQIFDPLGLLSACTIIAKITLQQLWLERLSWDDPIPEHLANNYLQFRNKLKILNNLKIPRHIICYREVKLELHGFCDSSEKAYGACIFIKSTDSLGRSYSFLLCAKSKVAPLKPVTLPRLELCGAVILSRLTNKVKNSLNVQFNTCYLWTDSSIVLSWLKTSANVLKTFVSNRVAEIQETTSFAQWRHVPGKDNPADLVSRGVEPDKIMECNLWWHGPEWLMQDSDKWPNLQVVPTETSETRKNIKVFTNKLDETQNTEVFSFERFSNILRLKRTAAYVFRFIRICKTKKRTSEPLSLDEIHSAFNRILKLCQAQSFSSEIKRLNQKGSLDKKSKLINLSPFLDEQGIMRVGGRLKHSEFAYDKKHPIILAADHIVTSLIFDHFHKDLMHAGPQLLLATIRETFWPLSGRNLARRTVHKCVKCFRLKSKSIQPIMGDLPAQRLAGGPPFIVTGVDYAGPFLIRDRKGRGCKLIKSYMCLFICFCTKAIHLELVTELSKESFLLAFKRFIARRGKPQKMVSDNGTNFIAASSELKSLREFLEQHTPAIRESLLKDNISWSFIPPYSPHFGGLWESGVRTVKHHLHRVLGNAHLTFEEFYSLLVQIEAIINSRPIHPLSCDPNDLSPLTPAHFLIGRPLITNPDPDLRHIPVNRLSKFQHIQQLSQHIWERWNKEYISELQKRTKWTTANGEVAENTLVLIKEDNLPPLRWKLGRVIELIRGSDGVARVFKIKTDNGIITRSFSKVCPLPGSD